MNEQIIEMIRNHHQKMIRISQESLSLTSKLAKANILAIMQNGNAAVPENARMDEEDLRRIRELILDEGHKGNT